MRKILHILAAVVAMAVVTLWLMTGAHWGWTQTQVTEMLVDPVTELEYPVIEDRFVAGVEIVGGGMLLALAFVGVSFLFAKQPTESTEPTKN